MPWQMDISETSNSLAPFKANETNNDKFTTIIANNSGGIFTITYTFGSGFGWPGARSLAAKYSYLQNSILYGAARRGDTWRGVRITFE